MPKIDRYWAKTRRFQRTEPKQRIGNIEFGNGDTRLESMGGYQWWPLENGSVSFMSGPDGEFVQVEQE